MPGFSTAKRSSHQIENSALLIAASFRERIRLAAAQPDLLVQGAANAFGVFFVGCGQGDRVAILIERGLSMCFVDQHLPFGHPPWLASALSLPGEAEIPVELSLPVV